MLKLKRKAQESLVVDGPAVITFTRLGRHEVQIVIDAPKTTKILRGELVPHHESKQEQPGAAAKDIALPPHQAD